ncbi:MAG: zinc-binding dehydrogenase [Streptosporangiales bacterium]|nr:zinc-binding dehydrogenase [Streptosporangiales bacterium]
MQAAVYERTGPAREVLRVVELPDPEPGPGEVRVRLRVSGVNPTDWRSRSGDTPRPMAFPRQTPGQDGAGELDAVGADVDAGRVGERVWVFHAAFGRPTGTAAQYLVLPADQAVPLPPGVDFQQAAGLGIPFMTAHRCLFADGPIDGHDVLVAGGAGAVGNAAIQLAKRAGARVITTVSSPAKAELARQAGADAVVVDYRRPEAAREVREFAPGGVQRIVEVALGTNLALDLEALAPGGTIITYARETADPALPVYPLMFNNLRLEFMLVYTAPPDALRLAVHDITKALRAGDLRPLPSLHFPLAEIAAAHEAVERGAVGKVVVDLP